ncbi:MAG TPA: methyltransferase domain-containing protein [Alphaproteobacteria bacterium]|jgi:SAM-dependent methyltransferase
MTGAGPAADGARRSAQIAASWRANAAAWTEAVRAQAIESRRVATDAAILRAALAARPALALDLGCGEGWLVRALADHGVTAVGVDGSAPLIDAAVAEGGGTFLCVGYDDIAADPACCCAGFDLVLANFALLDERVAPLFAALRGIMTARGQLLIQTAHGVDKPAQPDDGRPLSLLLDARPVGDR